MFSNVLNVFGVRPPKSKTSEPLCKTCRKTDFAAFANAEDDAFRESPRHRLGTIQQISSRASTCTLCAFVSKRAISKGFDELAVYNDKAGKEWIYIVFPWSSAHIQWKEDEAPRSRHKGPRDLAIIATNDESRLWGDHVKYVATLRRIQSVDSRDEPTENHLPIPLADFGRARLLRRDHANARLMEGWLELCQSRHKHSPCDSTVGTWPRHLYLVDVDQRCVVIAPQDCQYVALSYVWGTASSLKLDNTNAEDLFSPGALDRHEKDIAPTIRDTVQVTAIMGFKYLWMDALCIPQGNRQIKQSLMQEMHLVYANAALTIVAAAGIDVNHGLPGLRPKTRDTVQEELAIGDLSFVTTIHSGDERLQKETIPKWSTRAWTYEEQLFSRRQLIFTDGQVGWRCWCARWREEMALEYFDSRAVTVSGPSLVAELALDLSNVHASATVAEIVQKYRLAVGLYSKRELTYPYDALNAFKGVEGAFRRAVAGDWSFLWGIPEVAFTSSLAWTFSGAVRNNAIADWRAISKGQAKHEHEIRFPSWSWAGWQQNPKESNKKGTVHVGYGIPPKPEILWYRVGMGGEVKRVREDPTFGFAKGSKSFWAEDWRPQQEDWLGQPQTIEENETSDDDFVDSGILRCWTRTTSLVLRRHRERTDLTTRKSFYSIIDGNGKTMDAKPAQLDGSGHFDISLEDWPSLFPGDWKDEAELPLVAVALGRNWSFDTFCLLTTGGAVDGVRYRVGSITIPEVMWMQLTTAWQLVSLG